jgi:hypothetical protein
LWCLVSACVLILAGLLATAADASPSIKIHWSPSTPAPYQDITFTAGDADGTYTSWEWDLNNDGQFGDQTGQTITHSYRAPGDYAIAVTASNLLGETYVAESVVKVREPSGTKLPEASFVFFPTAPLVGEPVTFVSTSTDPDSPIPATALRWDLDGDGLFDDATGPSATVSFPVAGTFLIALQVSTNAKDVATLVLPVGTPAATVLAQRSFSLMSPFPVVRIVGRASKRGARIRRLSIDAPPGASVSVRCRGRGCPFKRARRTVSRRILAGRLPATRVLHIRRLEGRTLRSGAILRISVTRNDAIGKYTRFTIRKKKPPARADRCLVPGSTLPVGCPSR